RPGLAQALKISSLVQDDGHAAAKPSAMQAAARHVKSAGYQQGISGPGKFRQRETVQPVKTVAVKR
ncbi:hypothetical protein PU11_23495, partial [Escherichia coli]|uniref:hypothetical protein n=3 Tax=Escherichia coli TaxID=562 RepID=UPI00054443B2